MCAEIGDRHEPNGQVVGFNPLQAQYAQQYGPGNYVPNVFIQYWSMRAMAYGGVLVLLVALCGAWLLWRKKLATARWYLMWAQGAPFEETIAAGRDGFQRLAAILPQLGTDDRRGRRDETAREILRLSRRRSLMERAVSALPPPQHRILLPKKRGSKTESL